MPLKSRSLTSRRIFENYNVCLPLLRSCESWDSYTNSALQLNNKFTITHPNSKLVCIHIYNSTVVLTHLQPPTNHPTIKSQWPSHPAKNSPSASPSPSPPSASLLSMRAALERGTQAVTAVWAVLAGGHRSSGSVPKSISISKAISDLSIRLVQCR